MKLATAITIALASSILAAGPLSADMIRDRSGRVTHFIDKTETGAFVRDRSGRVTSIIETTKTGPIVRDRSGKRIKEVQK